jgi:hypothetical protein
MSLAVAIGGIQATFKLKFDLMRHKEWEYKKLGTSLNSKCSFLN